MRLVNVAILVLTALSGCSIQGGFSHDDQLSNGEGPTKIVPICGYCCGDVVRPDQTMVTIDATAAPLSEVVAEISRKTGANIIASHPLNGTVTIHVKEIPCYVALRDILFPNNFSIDTDMHWNLIRIVPSLEFIAEQSLEPIELRIFRIGDAKLSDLLPLVKDAQTPRGSVRALDRPPQIVVRDVREGIQQSTRLLRNLGVLERGEGN